MGRELITFTNSLNQVIDSAKKDFLLQQLGLQMMIMDNFINR